MKAKRVCSLLLSAAMLVCAMPLSSAAPAEDETLRREIDRYNYVIGTNAFSPNYQFTDMDPLFELSDRILAWGSNMVKFSAGSDPDLMDRVLAAYDFSYVFLWFRSSGAFRDGYSEEEAAADYEAFYALTQKLLRTYNGTGRHFYLGHWEGDWYYLDNAAQQEVDDTVTNGMIAWLSTRQKAVDDAKRDTPHENVYVWHYTEVNRPVDAMKHGYDRVVNRVLPYVNVDYVSYSAYDSMDGSDLSVRRAVDYIYGNLQAKSGVPGPRVFIGEVARPAERCGYNDARHCSANLSILYKYLQCDVQFVLYWQMYCNEKLADGSSRGYWLIDENGNETQLYKDLQQVFTDGKAYVERFAKVHGRVPTNREYRSWLTRHPVFLRARISDFFARVADFFRSLPQKLGALTG